MGDMPSDLVSPLVASTEVLPEAVCHYTTPGAAAGILQSQSIYASDIRFLNDGREYAYALELLVELLSARSGPAAGIEGLFRSACQEVLEARRAFGTATELRSDQRIWVSSFSERLDDLAQWRSYGRPSGMAIAFPPKALSTEPLRGHLLDCIYEVGRQREFANAWLESVPAWVQSWEEVAADERVARQLMVNTVSASIDFLAARLKHPAFERESEWRLIIWTRASDKNVSTPPMKVRPVGRLLVPYIEVPLARNRRPMQLHSVYVGPTQHPTLACVAARDMLDAIGIGDECQVRVSVAPYREF